MASRRIGRDRGTHDAGRRRGVRVTRRPIAGRPAQGSRGAAGTRDEGSVGSPTFLAPALSVIGLLLIAVLTISLFTGKLPIPTNDVRGGDGGGPDPNATVAPSDVVVVPTLKPQPNPSDAPNV